MGKYGKRLLARCVSAAIVIMMLFCTTVWAYAACDVAAVAYSAPNAAGYRDNVHWTELTATEATDKYNNGDKFIFMGYRATCTDCQYVGANVIAPWMNNYGADVYGVDADAGLPSWVSDALGSTTSLPIVAFIENSGITAIYSGNTTESRNSMNTAVKSFMNIISVESVSISAFPSSFSVGETTKLTATVLPDNATNKNVTWVSSKPSVASVSDDGTVTANSAGTATITVKTVEGKKTASCMVKVTAPTVNVTGIYFSTTPPSSINLGGTAQLGVTVLPADATNKSVTWSSDKPSVVSVTQSGEVTANAVGTAMITAVTNDGNKTVSCTITVNQNTVPVTDVTLSATLETVTVDYKIQLTATVIPADATNKNVIWSSSNSSVVSVTQSGEVTANATGMATIIVRTVDGNKTAICSIIVNSSSPDNLLSVSLDKYTIDMRYKDTDALKATASAAVRTINWKSSDESVAKVDSNGNITSTGTGTAVITASAADEFGNIISANCTVNVRLLWWQWIIKILLFGWIWY